MKTVLHDSCFLFVTVHLFSLDQSLKEKANEKNTT